MDSIFSKIQRMHIREKETFWNVKHQTIDLTDFEKGCKLRWDDEASRHLWTRYVYPFEDDSTNLLSNYDNALQNTDSLITHDNQVCDNSHEVDKLSIEIEGLLKRADKEIDNSQRSKEEAIKMRGKCQDANTKVDEYLAEERSGNSEYTSLTARRQSIY